MRRSESATPLRARDPRTRGACSPTPRDGRGRRRDRGAVHAHVRPHRAAGPDPGRYAVLAGPTRDHAGRDPRRTRPPADPVGWVVWRWRTDAFAGPVRRSVPPTG